MQQQIQCLETFKWLLNWLLACLIFCYKIKLFVYKYYYCPFSWTVFEAVLIVQVFLRIIFFYITITVVGCCIHPEGLKLPLAKSGQNWNVRAQVGNLGCWLYWWNTKLISQLSRYEVLPYKSNVNKVVT